MLHYITMTELRMMGSPLIKNLKNGDAIIVQKLNHHAPKSLAVVISYEDFLKIQAAGFFSESVR